MPAFHLFSPFSFFFHPFFFFILFLSIHHFFSFPFFSYSFFFTTLSFLSTLLSKVIYMIISFLIELIHYSELWLKMCCFTRKCSKWAMNCWDNCLLQPSELKFNIPDKPTIYKSVQNGVIKMIICTSYLCTVYIWISFVALTKALNLWIAMSNVYIYT